MSDFAEIPVAMDCFGATLVGVLHRPSSSSRRTAVLIVVGGPQYRVGSHRQFVLMARSLAAEGYPVLRFDYRGMGDSEGISRSFEDVAADLETSIEYLAKSGGPRIDRLVLLGLCDGASAILMHGTEGKYVNGLILINPWVRTSDGMARATVRHYYPEVLGSSAFWKRLFSGRINIVKSALDFVRSVAGMHRPAGGTDTFVDTMLRGWSAFRGPSLVVLSDRDLTAQEFGDLASQDRNWTDLTQRANVKVFRLPDADHTFSRRLDLEQCMRTILDWIRENFEGGDAMSCR